MIPMTGPAVRRDHLLFYDALCPFCVRSLSILRRVGLLERIEPVPLEEAAGRGLPPARAEGLRSEMLLWSSGSGEALSGFDVILRLLEIHARAPLLRALSSVAPVRALGRLLYRLVSLNRRIISPAATRGVACECDPPYRAGWRAALLGILATVVVAGSFLYGLALSTYQPDRDPALLGARWIAAAGAGGLASLAIFLGVLPRRFRELFWQGLMVLALGIAALAPFAASTAALASIGASPRACAWLNLLALVTSGTLMLRSTIHRHRNLGFPGWTPWLWLAAFEAGGLPLLLVWDLLGLRFL